MWIFGVFSYSNFPKFQLVEKIGKWKILRRIGYLKVHGVVIVIGLSNVMTL